VAVRCPDDPEQDLGYQKMTMIPARIIAALQGVENIDRVPRIGVTAQSPFDLRQGCPG